MAQGTAAQPQKKRSGARAVHTAAEGAEAGAAPAKLDPPSPRPRRDLAPARIHDLLNRLAIAQPNAECALIHRNAWELLVATILSAQCTDKRVNLVTPDLFRTFPTPQAMATASLPELEELVRTTGFFRNKAKSILGAAKAVSEQFHGEVPQTLAELITVPGAARKTANVVLGVAYGLAEGVVVDTHVQRLSNRLGLTKHQDPKKIEKDLMRIIPRDRWIAFSHELILHGRAICIARKPRCAECPLETTCWAPDKTWRSH
ncbi:endonuclease III [Acidipila sp. EB88]|uniref:endonuclease III n=1 Tax=Acidipila sp. EB88 TaxID=2305226 RepID=UPI001F1D3FFF|nr:endonuclease III [Acidipila sp. EB88]